MNKTKIIFIVFFVGSIVAIVLWSLNAGCLQKGSTALRDYGASETTEIEKKENNISKVCFNENCFNVEIADIPEERARGLMNREYLNQDSGMLFLFDTENKYSFWMKNTLIPLDIIWLDENKKVVFVKHNAESCETNPCETFKPNKKAKYIFEINSGLAREIGLKEGDYLKFK